MKNVPSARPPRRAPLRASAVLIILVLFGLIAWFALPSALQMLPPRYVARLPEPLQELAIRPHADYLPAPDFAPAPLALTPMQEVAGSTRVAPTAHPLATDTARPQPTGAPTLVPTQPPTPTPTARPPVVVRYYQGCGQQAGRAEQADLSQATVLIDSDTFNYTCQTWNNCGPATLTMDMSYYGWTGTQATAAALLKSDPEDVNVSPWQMAEYAQSQGFGALLRVGGTQPLARSLLDAGFAVLVERGFVPEGGRLGWMGHYQLLIGYSEPLQEFVVMDSYLGPDRAVPYAELEEFWAHFNYTYLVVYPLDQADRLHALIGADMNDETMYRGALARAEAQVQADPANSFAWFNIGTNLLGLGDTANAAAAYDHARQAGVPWRVLWYQFGAYEAYHAVGRYDDMITLANAVMGSTVHVEESFYYKGMALQGKGDIAGARAQYQAALSRNSNFTPAASALASLP